MRIHVPGFINYFRLVFIYRFTKGLKESIIFSDILPYFIGKRLGIFLQKKKVAKCCKGINAQILKGALHIRI